MTQDPPQSEKPADLRSVHTSNLPELFDRLGISLIVSTYQAGKAIVVRSDNGRLNTHFRTFSKPMGRRALWGHTWYAACAKEIDVSQNKKLGLTRVMGCTIQISSVGIPRGPPIKIREAPKDTVGHYACRCLAAGFSTSFLFFSERRRTCPQLKEKLP